MRNNRRVQFSLFGAETADATLNDLDGLVLAGGDWVRVEHGSAARLSVLVREQWRVDGAGRRTGPARAGLRHRTGAGRADRGPQPDRRPRCGSRPPAGPGAPRCGCRPTWRCRRPGCGCGRSRPAGPTRPATCCPPPANGPRTARCTGRPAGSWSSSGCRRQTWSAAAARAGGSPRPSGYAGWPSCSAIRRPAPTGRRTERLRPGLAAVAAGPAPDRAGG